MQRRLCWSIAAAFLALALLLPGCDRKSKKHKGKEAEDPAPARNEAFGGGRLPANLNPGIANNLPLVGRVTPLNDLHSFATYYLACKEPPKKVEEMPDLERDARPLYQAIKDGIYVVNWGARPGFDSSETILAHVRDAESKGGVVVLLDGSAHNYTAQQFQASPKIMSARQRPANERK